MVLEFSVWQTCDEVKSEAGKPEFGLGLSSESRHGRCEITRHARIGLTCWGMQCGDSIFAEMHLSGLWRPLNRLPG